MSKKQRRVVALEVDTLRILLFVEASNTAQTPNFGRSRPAFRESVPIHH